MATFTPNLGLQKPSFTDAADIDVLNSNLDKLDKAYGAQRLTSRLLGDFTMTNTTAGSSMLFNVAANSTYVVQGIIMMSFSATNTNIKFAWTTTNGASLNTGATDTGYQVSNAPLAVATAFTSISSSVTIGPSTAVTPYRLIAVVSTINAGTAVLSISPNTAVSGTLTMKLGSFLDVGLVS